MTTPLPNASGGVSEKPVVLVVESDLELLASRTYLFTQSNYLVVSAASLAEIFDLRNAHNVSVAVISDTLGHADLRMCAENIRRYFPHARIVVLGIACAALDDHLYDEAIQQRFMPKKFLDTLTRLINPYSG